MNILAVNGSARKGWNTHLLLEQALEGARSKGAQTELYNLYDLDFRGCVGCLECKRKGGASLGRCAMRDGLTPLLDKIHDCDALVIGSPIYFGEVTGETRSFLERLFFQYLSYDTDRTPLFGRKIKTAFFYTMNAPGQALEKIGYRDLFKRYEEIMGRFLGPCETLISAETLQADDYSQYHMSGINEDARRARRESVFPLELEWARKIGSALCE